MRVRGCVVLDGAAPEAVAERLRRLGVDEVVTVPGDDLTAGLLALADHLADGHRLVVVSSDLVAADAALGQLVDDPSVGNGLLVAPVVGPGHPVRERQRRVVSVGTDNHDVDRPSASSLGALVVSARDSAAAATALREMASASRDGRWRGDLVDHAAVALVRSQVDVSGVGVIGPASRSADERERQPVLAALADLDGARVLLERASRPDDGFYSTFVLRRLSKPLTAAALRLRLSPNQISLLSLVIGLAAAALFWRATTWAVVLAAFLLQLSLVVDCVDGEVARYTRRFSQLGAWLDASTDRVKEYAVYAGLAAGAARTGHDLWLLAAVVMVMQTVRHTWDYDFSRVQRIRETWVPAHDLAVRDDGGAGGSGATLELSARLNERTWIRWAKKVVHLPIGERWLVISVVSVAAGPLAVFLTLLSLGLLALAYTSVGRVLRTRGWRHPAEQSGHWLLDPQLDLGPVAHPLWSRAESPDAPVLARAYGWAVPGVLRLLEMAVVLLATAWVLPESPEVAFAWLFVVAYHHYDTLYRALGGCWPPRWLTWSGLGVEGRTVLVAGSALAGSAVLQAVLGVGAVVLLLLFVVVASVQWVSELNARERHRGDT